MKANIFTLLILFFIYQNSFSQDNAIIGDFWIDESDNGLYNDGEIGFSNVKVFLISADSNVVMDSTFTINSKFSFPSSSSLIIPSGTYYIEIEDKEFLPGGLLNGLTSCTGYNDADDGVDFDDNGQDLIPIQTTIFFLESGLVEYVDICLYLPCSQEISLVFESCDMITEEDIICDINTLGSFCGSMPSELSIGEQPNILCPSGGMAENISWVAFQAYEGNYSIIVTPTFCMGSSTGVEGIEVGVYTDCSFTEAVFCEPNCSTSPISIDSDLLVPGEIYNLYIDGCNGSVCSYKIDIIGAPFPPFIDIDELCIIDENTIICEDSDFLVGEEISFSIQDPIIPNYDFTWSITTISGEPYEGETSPMTTENNLKLTFENEGVYSVCISEVLSECNFWSGQECRAVSITNTVSVLKNDIENIYITPNPTFDFIYIKTNSLLNQGTYSIYSIEGIEVLSGNLDDSSKVNLRDLSAGLYIIRVVDNSGEHKFIDRFYKN